MAKYKSAVVDGDKITLDKKELEELRDHYNDVARSYDIENFHYGFYLGKADVCVEMLQCWDD